MLNGYFNLPNPVDPTLVSTMVAKTLFKELLNGAAGDFPIGTTGLTLGGFIDIDTASLNSPAGATPNLKSFTLPAGACGLVATTANAGLGTGAARGLRIKGWGTFANNVNAKTVILTIGGGATIATLTATASTANAWMYVCEAFVRSATTMVCTAFAAQGTGTPTHIEGQVVETVNNLGTATNVIQFAGTQTSAADIIQDGMTVEVIM